MLGRIMVVDNVDNAVKIARKFDYGIRMVTLEGELLVPGGAISGGAFKKQLQSAWQAQRDGGAGEEGLRSNRPEPARHVPGREARLHRRAEPPLHRPPDPRDQHRADQGLPPALPLHP